MKKILALVLADLMLLTSAALAEELIIHASVLPGGTSAQSLTIVPDEALQASVEAKFSMEVISSKGWGPNATTVVNPLTIYEIEYTPDGAITLVTDSFSPTAKFNITYAIPGEEPTVLARWSQDNVTRCTYAIVDDFEQGTYTGSYVDAEGKTVELSIVYRLYAPENAQGLPMVVTMHGSGESGNDGLAHVTASQITTCWADPAWQAKHPCIVLAPQWPVSDVSNDLELRDKYLEVYKAMIEEFQAKYAPAKTYMATLSMGSRVGFRYLNLFPETFDAALMVCGAKQNADLSRLSETPVWLVHAISDFVNKSQGSVDVFNQLVYEAGNKNVKLTLLTDEKMNGVFSHASWQYVFGNEEYMEWLFEQ